MSTASLSISNPIISISFNRMNAAKRKVDRAQEETRYEDENLSRAIGSLHVSDGRLRMKAEALNSMRSRINSRKGNLQRIATHIDYAVRRFQETDNTCAQRIKTNGYECRKVLGIKTSGGLFGNIIGGIVSVFEKGKAAWEWVKSNGSIILDFVQTGLDIIGLIPGLGEIADGLNALIYVVRGDTAAAALSLAAMIPIAGCAATAGKLIYKGAKAYKGAKNFVKVIDKAKDAYGIVKKVGNNGVQVFTTKADSIVGSLKSNAKGFKNHASGIKAIEGTSVTINTAADGLSFGNKLPVSSLNKRQSALLELLSEPGNTAIVRKKSVSMNDLRQLTNVTGDEFSMFTNKGERLLIRGKGNTIDVSKEMYADLVAGKYGKFSGHTHPGYSLNPGPADEGFLNSLQWVNGKGERQMRSSVWGNTGEGWDAFGKEPWLTQEVRAQIRSKKYAKYYGDR